MRIRRFLLLLPLLAALLVACGAASEESMSYGAPEAQRAMETMGMAMAEEAAAMPAAIVEKEVVREIDMVRAMPAAAPTAAPVAAAAAMPAAPAPAEVEVMVESIELDTAAQSDILPQPAQPSAPAQERIIIRTVNMSLVVRDISGVVDRIGGIAQGLGGWVVNADRSSQHYGFVSLRVPAQDLDTAIRRLRELAVEVESESSTSQDVTDEYVDINSRLRSLRATEEALLELLTQAQDVEDALLVRSELSYIQVEIEELLGRIKYLEQTSAYSLINVSLNLAPRTMPASAGPDQTFSAGQGARFRATFAPPEGIEDFTFTWDFGDGTEPVTGYGSAPTPETGQRITATVNHVYFDDRDSPYIVQFDITGAGPAGLVEGSDTLIATVTRIPSIEVFAGESRVVVAGEAVEYTGSFTRPEGLWDIQYRWDFGDGSPTVTGIPESGVTRATATHSYVDHRPQPYEVTLTVTAQSDAGEVKGESVFYAQVIESQGLIVGGWSAGDTAKTATRTLSAVVQGTGSFLIWFLIFAPVWLVLGGLAYGIFRLRRRVSGRLSRRRRNRANESADPETTPPAETPATE